MPSVRKIDMSLSARLFFVLITVVPLELFSQARPAGAGREFQIAKISKDFIPSPDYALGRFAPTNERWLEVEVEFNAAPEWTDELNLKYYILFNGRLLSGEVTHTNIPGGLNRSVMYVLPAAITRFAGNRPLLPNMIQNIAVQIVQAGAVKDELSISRASGQWFANLPPFSGFVLNKNETPFAPLYWGRYAQIKPAR